MSSVAVGKNGPIVVFCDVMEYGSVLQFLKLTLYGYSDYRKRKRGKTLWNMLS